MVLIGQSPVVKKILQSSRLGRLANRAGLPQNTCLSLQFYGQEVTRARGALAHHNAEQCRAITTAHPRPG